MPVYCYRCSECGVDFEARHSMAYEDQICTSCGSDNIFKIPSLSPHKATVESTQKVGKVVDEYIQDAKKEIKKEKQRLKTEEL